MSDELLIKSKTLAEEARIIRRAELRLKRNKARVQSKYGSYENPTYVTRLNNLSAHRRGPLRAEARATHLARAFLRGTSYSECEHICFERPDTLRIAQLAKRYGGDAHHNLTVEAIREWAKPLNFFPNGRPQTEG